MMNNHTLTFDIRLNRLQWVAFGFRCFWAALAGGYIEFDNVGCDKMTVDGKVIINE